MNDTVDVEPFARSWATWPMWASAALYDELTMMLERWFLGTKLVNAFRERIFEPQRFKTHLGNQSAKKRSF
jgi:hypothetical protein